MTMTTEQVKEIGRRAAQTILHEGKPVPPKVLSEYPDLAALPREFIPEPRPFDQNFGAQLMWKIRVKDARGDATDSDYQGLMSTGSKFGKGHYKTWRDYALHMAEASLERRPLLGGISKDASDILGGAIAQNLGIRYDGIQEGVDEIPTQMQFTDLETGSTTYGNTIEEVRAKIEHMRNRFQPFKKTTDIPIYDRYIKDPDYARQKGFTVEIQQMTPDEYLETSAKMQGTDVERQLDMVDQDRVKEYAGMMLSGTLFDLPYLDWARKDQEGRHRALAAKRAGYETMPVLVIRAVGSETAKESAPACQNLQPMAEWIKGDEPGTCRPCILGPAVQWYWTELKERGYQGIADQLEAAAESGEEGDDAQMIALCEGLDEIKKIVPEDLRKRLREFDCSIQSFDSEMLGRSED